MLEKTLESPLESKEIKSVNLKGNQPWILSGRTDAEAPIPWSPDVNSWLIEKDPEAGKEWRQKKRVTQDEIVGWHHWFNGHELGQTLGDTGKPGVLQSMGSQTDTTWLPNNKQQGAPERPGRPEDTFSTFSLKPVPNYKCLPGFYARSVTRDKEGHYIMLKESI